MAQRGVPFRPEVLRQARERKKWTVRDVSDATALLGRRVDDGNYSRYERGVLPRAQRWALAVLAQALEVDEDELTGVAA